MILAYFNQHLSLKEILNEFPSVRHGAYPEDAGTYFLKRNFSVNYLAFRYESHLEYLATPKEKVASVIGGWYQKNASPKRHASFRNYIEHGGIHVPRPVSEVIIRRALSKKSGVILGVSHCFLRGGKNEIGRNHAVIPIKISKTRIWINDPYIGVSDYLIEYLLLSSYACGGQALIIAPKF